ncbi:MAG: tol-pal system-associated acyl-CoA thioesterase [Thermodesulfovibrionales bacterium]
MAHRLRVKIYYEDTDAGGVVYYANYLRYLERARTELLAEKGIIVSEYHDKGVYLVVYRVDIRYRRPARLGDVIQVETEVREVKRASVELFHRVLRGDTLIAEADVTMACTDPTGRAARLPEAFSALGPAPA